MSCTHFVILLGIFLHICLCRLLPLVLLLLSDVFFFVFLIVFININFIYLPRSVLSGHTYTHTHTHTHEIYGTLSYTRLTFLCYIFDIFLLSILNFFLVRLHRKRMPSSSRCLHTKPDRDGNFLTFIMCGLHIYHCFSFEE